MKKISLELNEVQLISFHSVLLNSQHDLENKIKELQQTFDSNILLLEQITAAIPSLSNSVPLVTKVNVVQVEQQTIPIVKTEPEIQVHKGGRKGTVNWKNKILAVLLIDTTKELTTLQMAEYFKNTYTDEILINSDIVTIGQIAYSYCYKMVNEKELVLRKVEGKNYYSINPNHPNMEQYFQSPEDDELEIEEDEVEEVKEIVKEDQDELDELEQENDKDELEVEDDFEELEEDEPSDEDLKELEMELEEEDEEELEEDEIVKEKSGSKIKALYNDIGDDPEWKERMASLGYKTKK